MIVKNKEAHKKLQYKEPREMSHWAPLSVYNNKTCGTTFPSRDAKWHILTGQG